MKVNVGPSYNTGRRNARFVDSFDPRDTQQIPVEYQDPSSIALLVKYFGPDAHDYSTMSDEEQEQLKGIIQRRIDTLKATFRIFPPNSLKNISYGTKIQKMETLLQEIEQKKQLQPAPSAAQLAAQAAAERAAAAAGAVAGAAGAAAGAVAGAIRRDCRDAAATQEEIENTFQLIKNTFHAAYILMQRGEEADITLTDISEGWGQLQNSIQTKTIGDILQILTEIDRNQPLTIDKLEKAYTVFTLQIQLEHNYTEKTLRYLKQGYTSTFNRAYDAIIGIPVNIDISGQIGALYANQTTTIPSASALSALLEDVLEDPAHSLPQPLLGVVPATPAGTTAPPVPTTYVSAQEKAVFLTSAVLIKQYIRENPPQ